MGTINVKPAAEIAAEKAAAERQQVVGAVQSWMDDEAKTRGYDGILSLCSYATDPNARFSAEGQAGVDWRGAVWAECYQILADVDAGVRPAPESIDALISELPVMTWPS